MFGTMKSFWKKKVKESNRKAQVRGRMQEQTTGSSSNGVFVLAKDTNCQ